MLPVEGLTEEQEQTIQKARKRVIETVGKNMDSIVIRETPVVSPDCLLCDLFDICGTAKYPVAVVNDTGRIMGVIVRGAVLGALAERPANREVMNTDSEIAVR